MAETSKDLELEMETFEGAAESSDYGLLFESHKDELIQHEETKPLVTPRGFYQDFLNWWHHKDLLSCFPNFSLGFKLVTFRLWPTLFIIGTGIDVALYVAFPNDRYGNNLVKILTGMSTNQLTFTSNLGSDRVGSYADVLTGGLILAPLVNGILWVGLGRLDRVKDTARKILSDVLGWRSKNYLDWSQGQHQTRASNLFWPLSLLGTAFTLSIDGRYLWLAYNKARNIYTHLNNQNDCITQHKQFVYLPQSENYECTVCGEWTFVRYRDSFIAQSCLDSLLKQNMLPQSLAEYIQQFQVQRDFSSFNLSSQLWRNWTEAELNSVLAQAEKVLPNQIENFDISANQNYESPPSIAHMQRMAQFLRKINSKHVYARNQGLGAAEAYPILQANNASIILTIDLSNNPLGDIGADYVVNLMEASGIKSLLLENTHMTFEGVQKIAQANGTISKLVLTGNPISEQAFMSFANSVIRNNLRELVLGRVEIPMGGLRQFCLQIAASSTQLHSLTMEKIPNFNDRQAAALALCMNKLEHLDLSHNIGLTNRGATALLRGAQNGTLLSVNFGYCEITQPSKLAEQLPLTIQHVELSGNPSSADECSRTILALGGKNISTIIIKDVPCGNELGMAFAEAFANQSTENLTVIFSRTEMTALGAVSILGVNKAQKIVLSGNNLEGVGSALAQALTENQQLRFVDLSATNINATDIQQLITALPTSAIETLLLEENPNVSSAAMIQLEEQLISPMEHRDQLGSPVLSIDLARAFHNGSPQTQIMTLGAANIELNTTAILGFCRLEANLGIHVSLAENPSISLVDFHSCQISAGSRLEVPYVFQFLNHMFDDLFHSLMPQQQPQQKITISWIESAHQTIVYGGLSCYSTVLTRGALRTYGLNSTTAETLSKIPQLAVTWYFGGSLWMFAASQFIEYSLHAAGYSQTTSQQAGIGASVAINFTQNINHYGYLLGSAYTLASITISYASAVVGTGLAKVTAAIIQPSNEKISKWFSNKMSFWQTKKHAAEPNLLHMSNISIQKMC